MDPSNLSQNFHQYHDHIWLKILDECPWNLYSKNRSNFIDLLKSNGEHLEINFSNLSSEALGSNPSSPLNSTENLISNNNIETFDSNVSSIDIESGRIGIGIGNALGEAILPNYGRITFNKNIAAIHADSVSQLNACLKKLINLSILVTKPVYIKEVQMINARITSALVNYDKAQRVIFSQNQVGENFGPNKSGTQNQEVRGSIAFANEAISAGLAESIGNVAFNDESGLASKPKQTPSEIQFNQLAQNIGIQKPSKIPDEFDLSQKSRALKFLSMKTFSGMMFSQLRFAMRSTDPGMVAFSNEVFGIFIASVNQLPDMSLKANKNQFTSALLEECMVEDFVDVYSDILVCRDVYANTQDQKASRGDENETLDPAVQESLTQLNIYDPKKTALTGTNQKKYILKHYQNHACEALLLYYLKVANVVNIIKFCRTIYSYFDGKSRAYPKVRPKILGNMLAKVFKLNSISRLSEPICIKWLCGLIVEKVAGMGSSIG